MPDDEFESFDDDVVSVSEATPIDVEETEDQTPTPEDEVLVERDPDTTAGPVRVSVGTFGPFDLDDDPVSVSPAAAAALDSVPSVRRA